MGVLTVLFVASNEELRATFPFRVPVKPEPVSRETKNPFTGTAMKTKEWVPAEPFPENCGSVESQVKHERTAFSRLPHREYKGLDSLMLAALWVQIRGGDLYEHMNAIDRPALLAPGDPGEWIYRIPDELVSALSDLNESEVEEVARKWGELEEFQVSNWPPEDAYEVLIVLSGLSRTASESDRGLYLWVSL